MASILKAVSHSEEETLGLAEKISLFFKKGDVVVLSGELGAGKTVFVKGIAKALGIKVNHTGENLTGENIWVEDKQYNPKQSEIITRTRIGVAYAEEDAELPYRFLLNKDSIKD